MEVEYECLPGWKSSTAGLTSFSSLPPNAQAYVRKIEQLLQVPSEYIQYTCNMSYILTALCFCTVQWIGTGPAREDIITI